MGKIRRKRGQLTGATAVPSAADDMDEAMHDELMSIEASLAAVHPALAAAQARFNLAFPELPPEAPLRSTPALATHEEYSAALAEKMEELREEQMLREARRQLRPTTAPTQDKKTRRKARHTQWLQKLEAAKQVQVTEKKRAKAAKNPVKHMDLLEEALDAVARKPSGSAAAASNNKSQKGKNAAGRRVKSRKGRANALLAEVAQFNNVLAHSAFQNDPAGTIHQHIANTLAQHTQHAEQS
eukprot:m.92448 g.92448  ORF g.92448 m.92448 type:complete len:241 (-) comp8651_c0_seq1:3360-4082(-)